MTENQLTSTTSHTSWLRLWYKCHSILSVLLYFERSAELIATSLSQAFHKSRVVN